MRRMRPERTDVAASALSMAAPVIVENTEAWFVPETRSVDLDARTIEGCIVPYGEVTYLVPMPSGERILPGAFARSLRGREQRIRLFVGHARASEAAVGISRSFTDRADGLHAVFKIKPGADGDQALADAKQDMFGGFSIEFTDARRGINAADGVSEVHEARLLACTLVGTPAYERAVINTPELVAARRAEFMAKYAPPPRPDVDLSPFPTPWTR